MSQSTTPEWDGYYYRLADRIAKLEAAVLVKVDPPAEQPAHDWANIDRECVCGHGRSAHRLANPHVASWPQQCGAGGCACQVHRPVPAEQPASAPDELPAKCACRANEEFACMRVPPKGRKLCGRCETCEQPPAPAQGAPTESIHSCEGCGKVSEVDEYSVCEECRRDEQGAPAEPLFPPAVEDALAGLEQMSARLDIAKFEQGARSRDDEVAALEARLAAAKTKCRDWREQYRRETARLSGKLAAAERERDEAIKANAGLVTFAKMYEEQRDEALRALDLAHTTAGLDRLQAEANERERCLYHIETYEPRRDVPADWSYEGALSRVAEAIRDGKPASK